MLLVHEVVAQAGATVCDAAIGELNVELAERGGNVDDKEPMEEAYGCISAFISRYNLIGICCAYRKAGRRPKKAINVTNDTVTVKMMILRASVMVKRR